jgi:hypothetical protein
VAQSLCTAIYRRTCLLPLQVSSVWWTPVLARWNWLFHLMTVDCRSEMLFLILLYELYIFVDIMKHMKIVIYIYVKYMYSIYFKHVYFFITSSAISKLFLIQSTTIFCVCVCACARVHACTCLETWLPGNCM